MYSAKHLPFHTKHTQNEKFSPCQASFQQRWDDARGQGEATQPAHVKKTALRIFLLGT